MRETSTSCTGSASRRLRASRSGLVCKILCHVVAPAGSYRSGGGGNEAAEAFEKTGRSSDSASSQAVTRVNVEQAPKDLMWKPTRLYIGEGRSRWGDEAHAS